MACKTRSDKVWNNQPFSTFSETQHIIVYVIVTRKHTDQPHSPDVAWKPVSEWEGCHFSYFQAKLCFLFSLSAYVFSIWRIVYLPALYFLFACLIFFLFSLHAHLLCCCLKDFHFNRLFQVIVLPIRTRVPRGLKFFVRSWPTPANLKPALHQQEFEKSCLPPVPAGPPNPLPPRTVSVPNLHLSRKTTKSSCNVFHR